MSRPASDLLSERKISGRGFVPIVLLDAEGRRAELRIRDVSSPTGTAVVQPWACSECAAMTLDPPAHNEAHHG